MSEKQIHVYFDDEEYDVPAFVGILNVSEIRGKEVFSFEYSKDWLENPARFAIDPQLSMFKGRQYNAECKPNFGIFTDSAPDRWGRVLMDRRETISAKLENRKRAKLYESDYLIGVFDELRKGALRFKLESEGDFVNSNKELSAPPIASLRELEAASIKFEGDEDDSESQKWLNMLLAPGSSLGGARPKANVVSPDGSLWIAKFPSKNDKSNVEAWEMVANDLARTLGLNVAEVDAKKFGSNRHTFLSKRFDRNGTKRIHFASAMTLLGYSDSAANGASYLEIAEFISRYGAPCDLREMWTRIVFNICIGNSDDHLRNHGFLWDGRNWKLSPLYDITPNPDAACLSLNVNENENSLDLDLAMEVAPFFKVSKRDAKETIKDFANTVAERWDIYAKDYSISRSEIAYYESAFSAAISKAKF